MASAVTTPSLPIESLRTAGFATDFVSASQQNAYTQALDAYRLAEQAHPEDASLVVAQCRFIESFSDADEVSWSEAAWKDLDACRQTLSTRFPNDTTSNLYTVERLSGKAALDYGLPLVDRSKTWTPEQRARLHAALSKAYERLDDDTHAGEQALLVTQLEPGHERLTTAMRYLSSNGKSHDAASLLAGATVGTQPWRESRRIRTAAELLPANAARDELLRAEHAGMKIDPFVAALAYQRAGDYRAASAALSHAPASTCCCESAERCMLRFDIALHSDDGIGAAKALHAWMDKTGPSLPLVYAYGNLLALDPGAALGNGLGSLALVVASIVLCLAAVPAALAFTVHYRGTVRMRHGKPFTPLFRAIGLRHMWYALAILLVVGFACAVISYGDAYQMSAATFWTDPDEQRHLALTQLWSSLCAMALVGYLAFRLSSNEWLGQGSWKSVAAAFLVWFVAYGLVIYAEHYGLLRTHGTLQTQWFTAMTQGARSIGGLPLVLLLVAILAPLYEEFVFRGCVLGGLSRHLSFGWANFWQSALFSAVHADPPRFLLYMGFGALAGWLTRRTKGLAGPILLHAASSAAFVLWQSNGG